MNDNSKSAAQKRIEYILPSEIHFNPKSKYTLSSTEDLAESINMVGLQDPLSLMKRPSGKGYLILGGHRRMSAILRLIEEQTPQGIAYAEDGIPSIVEHPKSVELPLSDDLKERLLITTTNANQREKSDYDQMLVVSEMRIITEQLKTNGYKLGMPKRKYMSQQTRIDERKIQRLDFISRKLIEELQLWMKDEKLALTVTEDIAGLEEEEQAALLEKIKAATEIQQKDVDEYREMIGKAKKPPIPGPELQPEPLESPAPGPESEPEPLESPAPGPELEPEPVEPPASGPDPKPKPKPVEVPDPDPQLKPVYASASNTASAQEMDLAINVASESDEMVNTISDLVHDLRIEIQTAILNNDDDKKSLNDQLNKAKTALNEALNLIVKRN